MFSAVDWSSSLPVSGRFDPQILAEINQIDMKLARFTFSSCAQALGQGQGRMSGSLFCCSLPWKPAIVISLRAIWPWILRGQIDMKLTTLRASMSHSSMRFVMSSPRLCWHILVLLGTTRWRASHHGSSPGQFSGFFAFSLCFWSIWPSTWPLGNQSDEVLWKTAYLNAKK